MISNLIENPYYEVEKKLDNFEKYTTYDLSMFSDRVVELPWTFEVVKRGENPDTGNDIVSLVFHEGEVIEDGTPLSEKFLGNVDVGVAILYKWLNKINENMLSLLLKSDSIELSTLNGMIANTFAGTFKDMSDLNLIKGFLDNESGFISG